MNRLKSKSDSTPMTDKQLRDKIAQIMYKDGAVGRHVDIMAALFTTAQQQLLNELLKHRKWLAYDDSEGESIEAIPVSVVEEKLAERKEV